MRSFSPEKVPYPQDLPQFPQTELPIDIEIGCGVGLHPILYQKSHPDRYLVALEHTREKFEKFKRRFEKHGPPSNLLPIHANAISWITHYVPVESVERYYLLYPNPHPKDKQRNQRWHAMPFMEKMISTLKKGGTLTLASNEDFYIQEALEYFTSEWRLLLKEQTILASDFKGRTHFERKYLERGQTCSQLVFQRPLD